MATYKTLDLLNQISKVLNDGYFFVDISELEAEDDYSTSLSFEVQDEEGDIGYGDVDSLPDEEYKITITGKDYVAAFTLEEVALLHNAVSNALEYSKECQENPSYSKEDKAKIKSASVKIRNMQARLIKILKAFQ